MSIQDVLESLPRALTTFSAEPGFIFIRQAGKSGPELHEAAMDFLQRIEDRPPHNVDFTQEYPDLDNEDSIKAFKRIFNGKKVRG